MAHRYKTNQLVCFVRTRNAAKGTEGEFKIVRALPDNGGEPLYRIKSLEEARERVAMECELEVPQPADDGR